MGVVACDSLELDIAHHANNLGRPGFELPLESYPSPNWILAREIVVRQILSPTWRLRFPASSLGVACRHLGTRSSILFSEEIPTIPLLCRTPLRAARVGPLVALKYE